MYQSICLLKQGLTDILRPDLRRIISSNLALADAQLKHMLRYQMNLTQYGLPSKVIIETTFWTHCLFPPSRGHCKLLLSTLLEAYESG